MPEIIVKLGDRVVQKYLLYRDQKMTIGRAPDNDIAIENPAVSRRHSSIQNINGRYILEDHQSANGSYVNGVRITKTELLDKDVITIGKHKLHFYNQEQAADEPEAEAAEAPGVGALSDSGADVRAWLIAPGKTRDDSFELTKVETKIGRAPDNDVRLSDWFISKHHAVIGRKSGTYVIRDLESWRKTMVNGEIIQEATLNDGDEVHFGPKTAMRFEMEGSAVKLADSSRQPVELSDSPPPASEGSLMDQINAEAAEAEEEAAEAAYDGPPPPEEEMISEGHDEEPMPEDESAPPEEQMADDTDSEELVVDEDETPSEGSGEEEAPADEEPPSDESSSEDDSLEESPSDESPAEDSDEYESPVEAGEAPEGDYSPEDLEEIKLWEKALQNPSKIIRKQAARKLKKITGQDYDID